MLGKDAYKKANKFDDIDSDPHGYIIGVQKLLSKDDGTRAKTDDTFLKSTFDVIKPPLDNERDNLANLEEYGYGFWLRFLHTYPKRMLAGKN